MRGLPLSHRLVPYGDKSGRAREQLREQAHALTTRFHRAIGGVVFGGALLPAPILSGQWFAVLSAFVAINTVAYVVLAIAKMCRPRVDVSDLWHRRERRRTHRSIHPTPEERATA